MTSQSTPQAIPQAIPADQFSGRLPALDDTGEDVVGHDLDHCGRWHCYWKVGWIQDACGNPICVPHCHPYGTPFAVYRR